MGIEDLSLDMMEHADRVLVVCEDERCMTVLTNLLKRRNYKLHTATTLENAADEATTVLFDLVIFEEIGVSRPPEEIIALLRAQASLRRTPLILVHPNAPERSAGDVSGGELFVLPSPLQPSDLLVKAATALRLRKLRIDQGSFESKIASQNAQLRDLNTRYKHELKEAQEVQKSLLPVELPTHAECHFAIRYLPLEAVGGDLYDVWRNEDGSFGLFVGDVTGHGLPAAFIGAMTKMALSYADKTTVDKMFEAMSLGLSSHVPAGRFVTAIAARYEIETSSLTVVRAGHPPGILWRAAERKVERIQPKGMPLGIHEQCAYEAFQTTLAPGDRFFAVTDGLTETIAMDGEFFGFEGIVSALEEGSGTLDEAISSILTARETFSAGRILKDDITVVGLERRVK